MELKELGNTGAVISEIGLGTWRYRGSAETLRAGIERALMREVPGIRRVESVSDL